MTNTGDNPFRAGLLQDRAADPCLIVIFGATGDLAQRKLFPALMNLARGGELARETVMIAVSRRPLDASVFRATVLDSAAKFAPDSPRDPDFLERFAHRLFVHSEELSGTNPFVTLPDKLKQIAAAHNTRDNILFYLSVPPSTYEPLVLKLGASGLARSAENGWTRIIVEKPFGRDLQTARRLNTTLAEAFDEQQIYRIDHYLGKETVQNILVLRLANALFEPLWNYRYIDHVQITAAEALGVEDRAAYYEESGALRDMIQNHLLQILAMVAMEPPATLTPEAIRDEKNKALAAIRPLTADDVRKSVVRAQYAAGAVSGRAVPEYLAEQGVNPQSRTETFTALRLWIDNWRWKGVPFYLRTGKRMPKRSTEVAIQFRDVPHMVFDDSPLNQVERNTLAIRIQPNEGISLKFNAKLPGHALHLRGVDMEFRYGTSFGGRISDAYERLLLDGMLGDPTLYARRDAVEAGWSFASPILKHWEQDIASELPQYPAGSWGPAEADILLAQDGRRWRKI
ncbi:glucose-6-phosphate dehydrogenase [candidate division KSB1 bacterium]|nr:glucose-6-phosphate dehydrogenase [candidate division KSB1 bacterium]